MLFNSYEFLLMFLPVCLGGYYGFSKLINQRAAIAWLALCSLFFYGWWNPAYLWLMVGSILVNYSAGLLLSGKYRSATLLALSVSLNLLLLGYYKYTDFFISNINELAGLDWQLHNIILPLGISFFTFTQIAYLVDVYRGEVREYRIAEYFLFVTYFPHLIAGPIIHHKEMMPQFANSATEQMTARNITAGLVLFTIGLAKKILIADRVMVYVSPVFSAAENGASLTFFEAWGGTLAYTIQLYFDFSGYVDMALGISLLFGIRLPLNFDSPYKSTNIIDFWRRWHITLSRFLRDYLYIGLGGNRKGAFRRYINLWLTMLLGGLWHGAGWTFIIWGAMHGAYLCINHGWRALCQNQKTVLPEFARTLLYGTITFIAVVISWVFFRADTAGGALQILKGMAGFHGITLPIKYANGSFSHWLTQHGVIFDDNLFKGWKEVGQIAWPLLMVWLLPNSQTLLRHYDVTVTRFSDASRLAFRPNIITLPVCAFILVYCFAHLTQLSEFLYFRF
ncbi:MAG TPA: MBOAT family protein [Pseudomonadales bacterium]|nr:MBOAT family protein [Pseudomonadales bacterium]